MKKKLSIFLALILLLSTALCGCADDEEFEEDEDEELEEVQESKGDSDLKVDEETGFVIAENGQQYGCGLVAPETSQEPDENPNRSLHRSPKPIKFRPATAADGTPLGEEFYYYRNTLSDQGKKAYDQIRGGLLDGQARIEMSVPLSPEDAFYIYELVVMDGPELFYATNASSCSYNGRGVVTVLTPQYNDLVRDIQGNTQRMRSCVAKAVQDMMSLGEPLYQVKYAHDYLTHTTEYDLNTPYNQCAYSTLVNRVTVCAGYAHALQYLLQQVKIPCAYVIGNAGGPHAWSLLTLYGENYAMDVTWDDPVGASPDQYRYDYFNITDGQIGRDHHRERMSTKLPVANGTQCNYQNGFGGDCYGTDFDAVGQNPAPNPQPQPNDDWGNEPTDDGDWFDEEPGYDDGGCDDGSCGGDFDWWNLLDDSWTRDDWEEVEPNIYMIYDEETASMYVWNGCEETFYAMDEETEEVYRLNMKTGEWDLA